MDVLINGLIGCVAAIILWRTGVWPAGDAKLFMLLALIVPLRYYSNHYLPYFPAFALLVNSFFIAFSLLTLMVLADMARLAWRLATGALPFKQSLSSALAHMKTEIPTFLKSTLGLIGIFIPARIIGDYLMAFTGAFFSGFVMLQFLLAFLLYRQIMTFMSKRVSMTHCVLVALAGIIVKFILTGYDIAALALYVLFVLKIALVFMAGISALTKIFSTYIKMTQTTEMPARELERGMLIEKEFWTGYAKENKDREMEPALRPEGLRSCQITALNETLADEKTVPVLKTYPFAPVLFCGALLTMALKQSMLHFIIAWFKR